MNLLVLQPGRSAPDVRKKRANARKLRHDIKVLVTFVRMYCDHYHRDRRKGSLPEKLCRHYGLTGQPVHLCRDCSKLLTHAVVKRNHCPLDPKPSCKHCPQHCYAPTYRNQIRAVMKDSGRRLVFCGRLHYLLKLWF